MHDLNINYIDKPSLDNMSKALQAAAMDVQRQAVTGADRARRLFTFAKRAAMPYVTLVILLRTADLLCPRGP